MKTNFQKFAKITAIALAVTMSITSCRKDDEPQGLAYNTTEIQNSFTTVTPINDATGTASPYTPGVTSTTVNIATSGTISDLSKMFLEVNLAHTFAGDISMALKSPDGTEKMFVYRISTDPASTWGSEFNYIAANTLTFNNTFTATLPTNTDIPTGNYKESLGKTEGGTISLEPIFSSFNGKQISGTWTLTIKDYYNGDTGSLQSWKLRFAPGAVKL